MGMILSFTDDFFSFVAQFLIQHGAMNNSGLRKSIDCYTKPVITMKPEILLKEKASGQSSQDGLLQIQPEMPIRCVVMEKVTEYFLWTN